jgi:hypothetical protein
LNGTRIAGSAFDLYHYDNIAVKAFDSYCFENATNYDLDEKILLAGFRGDPTGIDA